MKLYNSLSQTLEEFKPIHEGKVNMYVCGPTVYNYPHIGNARPIVVFDTWRRTFIALGYDVKMVSNYTDVDDKIIKVAKECGVREKEITEKFIDAYNADRRSLHAMMPDAAPKVTDTMEAIINFIQLLIDKGNAYAVDGDVYFRVNSVKSYGSLSHQQTDDLMVGARIDENSKKENPLDFTLWKRTVEGIQWTSPWSNGRPGWHTECVVMINQQFDDSIIDIHGGGIDLKFPHHENEIAQSMAAYATPIAQYWIHNGMVNIDGEKMSKSLGNVIWAKDMIAKIGGNVLRWLMLSTHYRSPLNVNEEAIETASKELSKVYNSLKQAYLKFALADKHIGDEYDNELYNSFMEALQDDLNTPNAFAVVFDTVKALNQSLRQRDLSYDIVSSYVKTLEKMMDILGIEIQRLTLGIDDLDVYNQWRRAVKKKDFAAADTLRKELMDRGIL